MRRAAFFRGFVLCLLAALGHGCSEDRGDSTPEENDREEIGPHDLSLLFLKGDHTFDAQVTLAIKGRGKVPITAWCLLEEVREPKGDDACWHEIEGTEELDLEVDFDLAIDPHGSLHTVYLWLKNAEGEVSRDYASASINLKFFA